MNEQESSPEYSDSKAQRIQSIGQAIKSVDLSKFSILVLSALLIANVWVDVSQRSRQEDREIKREEEVKAILQEGIEIQRKLSERELLEDANMAKLLEQLVRQTRDC